MNQRWGFVLGQIVETGLDQIRFVVTDREGNHLRFLVNRTLNHHGLVGLGVGVVPANDTLFVDRQLDRHNRARLAGLG